MSKRLKNIASEETKQLIKNVILKKILGKLLAFLGVNALPIIGGIIVVSLIIGGSSSIFTWFSNTFSSSLVSDIEKMQEWSKNLTDEEIEEIMASGSTINPRKIPDYIDSEKKSIESNKKIKIEVKETVIDDGDRDIDTWEEDYELKLYNASYPYRLQWKLIAGIDIIIDNDNIINQVEDYMSPKYEWGYDSYSKDVTNSEYHYVKRVCDGDEDETITITHTEKRYPLPYLKKVEGVFNDYTFSYDEDVVTKDEDWSEPYNVTSRTYRHRVKIGPGDYETHTDTYYSYYRKKQKIVMDIAKSVEQEPRIDRITGVFEENKATVVDIGLLSSVVNAMPDTQYLVEDLINTIAIIGIENGGIQGTPFNPNIPIIQGDWTRADLLDTAMSLLDLYYFWGGKYPKKGANPEWGKPKVVSAKANWATNKVLPYGMDCSGFVDWVYYQMLGTVLAKGGGTSSQVANTYPITESELKIGDLGFLNLGNKGYNHVGIYAGKVNGKNVFIHCGGRHFKDSTHRAGRVLISYNDGTSYKGNKSTNFKYFRRVYVNFKDDNVVGSVNQ